MIHPWRLDSKSDTLGVFQRNPYYFKVDAAGNQLPYIDAIRVPLMGMGSDAYLLQGLAGEIDFGLRGDFGDISNFSVLRNAEEEGNFRLHAAMSAIMYHGTVYFNFASEDSERRELFNDIKFRRAIALAIDGQEINDLLFRGQYTLSQTPVAGDLVHPADEPYKEHDLDAANRMLDELGLAWNSNRTARTFPSGKPLELFGLVETDKSAEVAMSEIYKEQFKKVGVEFLIRPYAGEAYGEKLTTGDYDILVGPVDIGRGIPTASIARFSARGAEQSGRLPRHHPVGALGALRRRRRSGAAGRGEEAVRVVRGVSARDGRRRQEADRAGSSEDLQRRAVVDLAAGVEGRHPAGLVLLLPQQGRQRAGRAAELRGQLPVLRRPVRAPVDRRPPLAAAMRNRVAADAGLSDR